MTDCIRVYVVTYRRPKLLERALRSLIAQTHVGWIAEVLNDDPTDPRVSELIARLADRRIQLSQPSEHRGGTGNFNYAFRTVAESFSSILEDDNWWEPGFLATMLSALVRHPNVAIACGNERIWIEKNDGSWVESGRNVWAVNEGESLLQWNALDKCGGAKLCNSSLLFRTAGADKWQTPAGIPIDVTEHFRERVAPHPILLVHKPLVNYAQTLMTSRSSSAALWASYQLMLVGSVFAIAQSKCRAGLARALWERARNTDRVLSTTLLATGLFVPSARILWDEAWPREKTRFVLGLLCHPRIAASLRGACDRQTQEWNWLQRGAFANFMAQDLTFAETD
jgi:hypothetical protein